MAISQWEPNEATWHSVVEIHRLFWFLDERNRFAVGQERKTRLFLAACLRCLSHMESDEIFQSTIQIVERYSDGGIDASSLASVHTATQGTAASFTDGTRPGVDERGKEATAWHALEGATLPDEPAGCIRMAFYARTAAYSYADDAVPGGLNDFIEPGADSQDGLVSAGPLYLAYEAAAEAHMQYQASLFRDIFGPILFRPVAFSPSWRSSSAVALASQMYESRVFDAMPILADALQDAGCDSAEVLNHCRGPGPHVRGCWVVDLVLGKE